MNHFRGSIFENQKFLISLEKYFKNPFLFLQRFFIHFLKTIRLTNKEKILSFFETFMFRNV